MDISDTWSGDLDHTLLTILSRFYLHVLYRVGVHSEFRFPIFILSYDTCLQRCWAPSNQLDNSEDIYEQRSRDHTDFLAMRCKMGVLYNNYGIIRDIIVWGFISLIRCSHWFFWPFTNKFPWADIHELIAPDLLHQIIKGTFKDHLVTWVEELLLRKHNYKKAKVNRILDDIDCWWVLCSA